MAELARGAVADRPWGRTLGALGLRGLTGQLTLTADGRQYQIAFASGAVVGAASPLASDAAVRVALTGGLVSSTQVADLARRAAAAPHRDEIELISELVRIPPDQALRLRRRVVAQRAARTFSVERGEFVIDDQVTIPVVAGSELDIRAVVYLGAHQNLSEARLAGELAGFGAWFRLQPSAYEDLSQFGFTASERPVLEKLRDGAVLDELDATGVEPRTIRVMLYALVCCNACELGGPGRSAAAGKVVEVAPPRAPSSPPVAPARAPAARATRTEGTGAAAVNQLISQRLRVLDQQADHYALLGVAHDASAAELRRAYFALARQLHPDRLAALGIPDEHRDAQRLFAQVNTAFAVLSDPQRRADYTAVLRRGGEAAVRAEQAQAEAMTARIVEGEQAFHRGEAALRRDQPAAAIAELTRAVELNPEETDYQAMLAWAQFCAAPDKHAVATTTRSALDRAIARSPRAITARFYLGRVERMLGRDHDALRHFQAVLQSAPHHSDAASEARVIEARLASGPSDKGGGLFRRR
ncbi:MAG: J domain-containing protein [Kofleriaceae bacterium]